MPVGPVGTIFSLDLGPNRSLAGAEEFDQWVPGQGAHRVHRFSILRTSRFAVRRFSPDSICPTRLQVFDLFGSITVRGCNDVGDCFDLVVHGELAINIQVEVAISRHKDCCRCLR